jgi:hypothetical protein
VWIKPSTGRLCVELEPPKSEPAWLTDFGIGFQQSCTSLLDPPGDSEIITSISLQDYHSICYFHLNQWHRFSISTNVPVKLGSIRQFSGLEYENSLEITFVPNLGVYDQGWSTKNPIIKDNWNPYVQHVVPCIYMSF